MRLHEIAFRGRMAQHERDPGIVDSSRAILRILFVEMAAQQSATRKKGKEWLILARGASPGKNTQSECLPKHCRTVQCPPGARAPGQY